MSPERPTAKDQPGRVEQPQDLEVGKIYIRHFFAPLLEDRTLSDPVATHQTERVIMRGWDGDKPKLERPDGHVGSFHLSDLGFAPLEDFGWHRFHYLVPA